MKTKNKDYDINELVSSLDFNSNKLQKVNDKLILTAYQIEILKRYNIDAQSLSSLREVIYFAEEAYEETEDEELEIILDQLSERNYYENIPK